MKISLTGKQLRAALHNAAVKDVRYYLNGLYFYGEGSAIKVTDPDGTGQLVIMPMTGKGFKK